MRRSEDRSQSATTRHTNGMTTGPCRYNQMLGGRDQQALTGPEGARGPTTGGGERGSKPRESGPNRNNPDTKSKKSKATKQETPNSNNKRKEPRSTQRTTRKAQRQKDTRHKGQPEQAVQQMRPFLSS